MKKIAILALLTGSLLMGCVDPQTYEVTVDNPNGSKTIIYYNGFSRPGTDDMDVLHLDTGESISIDDQKFRVRIVPNRPDEIIEVK